MVIVPFLLVLITFLFWYQTWFGRRLTESEMGEYLSDTSVPHKTQHALAQLAERIARGDTTVREFYPKVLGLAANPEPEFRLMAAWVMGQDNKATEFHQALLRLLSDPEPMVRWNAALGLARFGDSSARHQLRLMLRPFIVSSPSAGKIHYRVKDSEDVRRGVTVASLQVAEGQSVEIHSPMAGQVERLLAGDGASVGAGDGIARISPAEDQIYESLRALYLVGDARDLEDVDRFVADTPGRAERVREQAKLTAQAIRTRAVKIDK